MFVLLQLISLFIAQIRGEESSKCIPNFIVTKLHEGTVGSTGALYHVDDLCYEHIPDFNKRVFGYQIKHECLLHRSLKFTQKNGHNISRCGEYLELKGPLEEPFPCLVSGFYWEENNQTEDEKKWIHRLVGVNEKTLTVIAAAFNAAGIVQALEIGIRPMLCPFKIPPTIYVEPKKEETEITLFDIVSVPELLEYNGTIIYADEGGRYKIPKSIQSVDKELLFVSMVEEKLSFGKVDLSKKGFISNNKQFTISNETVSCPFAPTTKVYNVAEGVVYSRFFEWKIAQKRPKDILNIGPTNETVTFESYNNEVVLLFYYRTAFQLGKIYEYLDVDIDVLGEVKPKSAFLSYNPTRITFDASEYERFCGERPLKYHTESIGNKKRLHLRINTNKNCKGFVNVVEIKLKTDGAPIQLSNTFFKTNDDIDNTRCDLDTLDCKNTECTIGNDSFDDGTTSPWKKGCGPTCGSCRIGLKCSSSGFCVKEPNYNQRSSSKLIMLSLVAIILVLV